MMKCCRSPDILSTLASFYQEAPMADYSAGIEKAGQCGQREGKSEKLRDFILKKSSESKADYWLCIGLHSANYSWEGLTTRSAYWI